MENSGGAYFRKELMVVGKTHIPNDENEIRKNVIAWLAHELGHNWFLGANTSSWEDWLNETGAEWAALLYILLIKKDGEELFSLNLSWAKDTYKNTPVIKSPDLKRPAEGVHTRGVMLFHEIYLRYSVDTIKTILQTLAGLEEVTTDNFLSELRAKIGGTIPDLIERGLTTEDYAMLFA